MGEGRGTWEGREGRRWPPGERPRSRDEARLDVDARTERAEINRRHGWRGAGRGQYRGDYRGSLEEWTTAPAPPEEGGAYRGGHGGEPRGHRGEEWPPSRRPRSREEARADLDRRTDEEHIDHRHAWRGEGRGAYGGSWERWSEAPPPRAGGYRAGRTNWPPSPRPRSREDLRADLDRRTDEEDIDRRHAWRTGGREEEREREAYRGAEPEAYATGEDWPPSRRPRSREEARRDVDWRTDEPHIDRRHGWRAEFQEPWPPARRPRSRDEAREDLDRRTAEREIDRRHAYRHGPEARMAPPRMAPPREPGELREDLARRTGADEINRRHGWRGGEYRGGGPGPEPWERRGFAGPDWADREPDFGAARGGEAAWRRDEGRRGEARFDERPYLEGNGGEERAAREEGEWDERGLPYSGGYGGYGGGEYGGSYGGIGPGRTGTYPPSTGPGFSGGGSMLGEAGNVSGWEENREMGPNSTASMLDRATRRGWAREGPLVRDLMTKNPRSVGPDESVVQAAKAMREEDAGIIPVTVDGRVIGVVTDRDLAMRVLAEGKGTDAKVSEVMSEDVHVCTQDDRIVDAVRVMGEENVRRLPVVDRDDRLLGILSMTDVAREAELDYALQEALEQLASRRSFWSSW
jgi:CBS domain-containing protein